MNEFTVEIRTPTGDHFPTFERIQLSPVWYSATAVGGFESADIRADGPADALPALLRILGYTANILNGNNTVVWSGVIDEVTVSYGAMQIGLSIRNIANRVAVTYTQQTADGTLERATTTWAEDTESITRYGYAERMFTKSDVSQEQAEAYRDTMLAAMKNPTPLIKTTRGGTPPSAMLACSGQWALLSRQLYSNTDGLVEYNTTGGSDQLLGVGKTSTQIGFTGNKILDFGNTIDALLADVSVIITGSTSNNVTVTTTRAGVDGTVYTASTISFDPADDVLDSANGLSHFNDDDMVIIAGSASNSGTRIVPDAVNAGHITVGGATIVAEAAGPSITLTQAGYVETSGTFTDELPGATTTLRVVGTQIAQRFTLAATGTWTVNDIAIRIKKVGSPADNVAVALYTDSAGSPGSSIESTSIGGSTIGTAMTWHRFTFANTNSITYGTNYWIVVSRTGSNSMSDYYVVDVAEDLGYSGGNLKLHNGSTWVARSPDADMPFIVRGATETTAQISNILTNAAQFISSIDVQQASSVESNQYRYGDGSALFEIAELLNSGTSSGARLLAKITPKRIATIYAQPTSSRNTDLIFLSDGTLTQPTGSLVESGALPAGKWVRVQGVQTGVDHLAPLAKFFIERAEYHVDTGDWVLEPPSTQSVWDMGMQLS